jgi:large subunit ribosomal protein L21
VKLGGKNMKYAIVEKGGKQYKVTEAGTIDVDLFSADIGDKVDLERVLLIADGDKISVGTPTVNGAQVKATVVAHVKGPKIVVFKYRPRKRYRVKTGHRQKYIRLQIDSITLNGKKQAKKRGKNGS